MRGGGRAAEDDGAASGSSGFLFFFFNEGKSVVARKSGLCMCLKGREREREDNSRWSSLVDRSRNDDGE